MFVLRISFSVNLHSQLFTFRFKVSSSSFFLSSTDSSAVSKSSIDVLSFHAFLFTYHFVKVSFSFPRFTVQLVELFNRIYRVRYRGEKEGNVESSF